MKPEYIVVMRRQVIQESTQVVSADNESQALVFARSRANRNLVEWNDIATTDNGEIVQSIDLAGDE